MTAIYTIWARLPNDEGAWMIGAEDEWSWAGDPERCEAQFTTLREKAASEGQIVRGIIINIDQEAVEVAFRAAEIEGEVRVE